MSDWLPVLAFVLGGGFGFAAAVAIGMADANERILRRRRRQDRRMARRLRAVRRYR